ncbi:MAG: glycosyltransferase [Bdellovibrionales bacterium]
MKIAVIIPCLNEEATIALVVRDCAKYLPDADVYVFDNGSDDQTTKVAEKAGARVIYSPLRGKGNAIRHAFRVVDADYIMMIDGDGTYPVREAPRLIKMASENQYAMVMGSRLQLGLPQAFRPMHYSGNRLFSGLVSFLFGFPIQDLLTGQRVFSRHFVKNMQLVSRGFEVETELTIRALMQNLPMIEVSIPYVERPEGSKSKLRTFRDGFIILKTVGRLWKHFRPLRFYSLMACGFFALNWLFASSACAFAAAAFWCMGFFLEARLESQRLRLHPGAPATLKNSRGLKKSA